jgi:transposase
MAEALVEATGWPVSLAHPGYVNRMKQSPDKSDWTDAKVLGDLVRVGYLPKVWLVPPKVRQLRELVRYRQQLVNERRGVKLRIRSMLRNHRVKSPAALKVWTAGWMAWLGGGPQGLGEEGCWVMEQHLEQLAHVDGRIKRAQERLTQVTAGDALVSRLREQPGIGPVTSWVMRAEIGSFERFADGKQLSRFCGLSPRNASSGARQVEGGLVKAGNNLLRATLIEAAHRLRRRERRWSEFSARMQASGKSGSVIAAAVANRWMRRLYWTMTQKPAA